MQQYRVFVTGAAGFIGYHLCKRLHGRGYVVLGYDNFNHYYAPALKEARAKELKALDVDVIRGDVADLPKLTQTLQQFQPTHIVHLAAQAGVRYSVTHPQAYLQDNLNGFGQMLEACRLLPGVKFIYASSSSVYGLNSKIPFAVEDVTDTPASLYAATKKANEVMAHAYHHMYGIPVTGLRFFTVYGNYGRPDMAYWMFTKGILEGKTIDVFHEGKMRRDFTHVDDVVAGIESAMIHCRGHHLYNLGNDEPAPLGDFIRLIEKACGKSANIRYLPMPAGDVVETWADISRSRDELGYAPTVSLETGIPAFVDWYRSFPHSS